jgi:hypothetical protein
LGARRNISTARAAGLHIVEALSLAAAYYPSPTGVGKVTWCQIAAPAPPEAEEPGPRLPYRRVTVARAEPGLVSMTWPY